MDDKIIKAHNECTANFKTLCRIILLEYSYILYESSMNEALYESKCSIVNMMLELGYLEELNEIALKTRDYELICKLDFYNNYERDDLLDLFENWTMINKQSVVNAMPMDIIPDPTELSLRPSKHISFVEYWTNYVIKILRSNNEPSDVSCTIATKFVNRFVTSEKTDHIHVIVKDLLFKKFPQLQNVLNPNFSNSSYHYDSSNTTQKLAPNILQSSMAILNMLSSKCSVSEVSIANNSEALLDLNRSKVSLEYITKSQNRMNLNEKPYNVMKQILDNNLNYSTDRLKQAISYIRSLNVAASIECRVELFYMIVEVKFCI